MVKTIVTIIITTMILIGGAFYETHYINKSFNEFHQMLNVLYDKVDNQTATQDDVYAVQKYWIEKKHKLHTFIPHNDIKEIDLWLSESVTLVRDKEWADAISKIEVLKELAEQIPHTFVLALENIL